MKRLLVAILALLGTLAAVGHSTEATANDRYGKQKVVYHINYPGGEGSKAYKAALRNIQNHINAVGKENLDLRVVLHGNGVGVVQDAVKNMDLQSQVIHLKQQNVSFQICNNTLTGRKISYEKDLFEVEKKDIVPSGVAELAHLQKQGYTYIKP